MKTFYKNYSITGDLIDKIQHLSSPLFKIVGARFPDAYIPKLMIESPYSDIEELKASSLFKEYDVIEILVEFTTPTFYEAHCAFSKALYQLSMVVEITE